MPRLEQMCFHTGKQSSDPELDSELQPKEKQDKDGLKFLPAADEVGG